MVKVTSSSMKLPLFHQWCAPRIFRPYMLCVLNLTYLPLLPAVASVAHWSEPTLYLDLGTLESGFGKLKFISKSISEQSTSIQSIGGLTCWELWWCYWMISLAAASAPNILFTTAPHNPDKLLQDIFITEACQCVQILRLDIFKKNYISACFEILIKLCPNSYAHIL